VADGEEDRADVELELLGLGVLEAVGGMALVVFDECDVVDASFLRAVDLGQFGVFMISISPSSTFSWTRSIQ